MIIRKTCLPAQAGKYTLSLVLVLLVIGAYWFYNTPPEEAVAGWWNDQWTYRRAIPVTNDGSAQTNVFIELDIDTKTGSTSMQADCGDFRFLTQKGEILDYYIVSGCRTSSNIIHVNFTTFPAGAQAIYFYYGNPSAENGFSSADFDPEATSYTIGAVQATETGPGPVGHWTFNEGYGTTVYDESGKGNVGTITDAVWVDESLCVAGKCLYFDGDADYVQIDYDASLALNEFTVSAWAKVTGALSQEGIFSTRFDGSDNTFDFKIESNRIHGDIGNGSTWLTGNADCTVSLETGDWHHITYAVYTNGYDIYVDGVYCDGNTYSGTPLLMEPGSMRIGHSYLSEYMNGFIDEVKIYPYTRTADQVRQDYMTGLAGAGTPHSVAVSFGSGSGSGSWMSEGLVAYWKFDEPVGTYDDDAGYDDAIDSSGNGLTGDANNTASTAPSKFGNGAVFDGGNDNLLVQDNSALDITGALTVSVWLKYKNTGLLQVILGKAGLNGVGTNGSYMLEYGNYSDKWRMAFTRTNSVSGTGGSNGCGSSVNWDTVCTEDTNFSPDTWYHIVGTWDGTTDPDNMKIYVNGVEDGAYTSTMTGIVQNNNALNISGTLTFLVYDYKGSLDEMRIYNRALSANEVAQLYKWTPGPVAHWKFDEIEGTTAYDSVASTTWSGGNHGTLACGTGCSTVPAWSVGKYAGALEFGDERDYVDVDLDKEPINTSAGTFGAWVKRSFENDIDVSHPTIFYTEADASNRILLFYNYLNDDWEFTWDAGGTSYGNVDIPANSIPKDVWTHISMTWDTAADEVKTYVNGAQEGSTDTGLGSFVGSLADAYIGVYSPSGSYYIGAIDDVRIYNYARDQKQIINDMFGADSGGSPAGGEALYLKFDEGYGEIAHDSSISANNGTIICGEGGSITATTSMWSLDGKMGRALEFDGADDYINLGDLDQLENYSAVSLAAWIKATSTSSWNVIVGKELIYKMDLYNGNIRFLTGNNWAGEILTSDKSLSTNIWYHVAAVYDGSIKKLYINGRQDNNTVSSEGGLGNNTRQVSVGAYDNGSIFTMFFDGLIDEAKIYSFALTADEVKQEYNLGKLAYLGAVSTASTTDGTLLPSRSRSSAYCVPGDDTSCAPPVLELKMDEFKGTTTYDTSGQANHGVFVSADTSPTWTPLGAVGSALEFDGDDDYVITNLLSEITKVGYYTFSAWLYVDGDDSGSNGLTVFQNSQADTDRNGMSIGGIGSIGYIHFGYYDGTWTHISGLYNQREWFHAVGVNDGGSLSLYLNGIAQTDTDEQCYVHYLTD
ncbi:DUF2341 domain-containing protein, partial [Patescibacteria group bacterium]